MPQSTWPPKDFAIYKKMCKALEKKNFKLGLKHARAILSNARYMNDADTLAVKALLLHGLERYDEAFECVNKGLKQDIKCMGCWQASGHLYRSKRKLEDALKCFRNAFKIDPKNALTLRNLCLIQIQMRDLDGFRETCYLNLQSHPTQRVAYVSYLVACHLSKKYDVALEVLKFLISLAPLKNWELSELYLYENCLLRETGNWKGALEQLLERRTVIIDKIALDESLAQIYFSLNRFEEAEEPTWRLIERVPDNKKYYEWMFLAKRMNEDDQKAELLLKFYRFRSDTPRLLRLKYLKGDELKKELKEYLKRGLIKGIPSLFTSLRFLYSNHDRVELIERILKDFVSTLKSTEAYDGGDKINKEQLRESATALVWTYFFLGQHYDRIRDPATALKYINSAIEHTPTLPDLYLLKARVFKHAGDNLEACRWAEEAMNLDMADRYLNSKCVKYMFRAGLIEEGREISSKMVSDSRRTEDFLKEMQCMWYEIELALAYDSQSQWRAALKKCRDIDEHFEDISFEQIDFHVFCYRKMALCSYVQYLQAIDNLRNCRFYRRAALCALKIHLREHDRPEKIDNQDALASAQQLSASEIKKLKNKQRKAALKAKKQPGGERETKSELEEGLPDKPSLEQAKPYLHGLLNYNSNFLDSYIIAFEVFKRLDKRLLMLQSVVRAYKLAGLDHPKVHAILTDFCSNWATWSCSQPVTIVIQRVLNGIVEPKNPIELNEEFLKRNGNDYTSRLCYARTLRMLSQRCSSSIPENWRQSAVRQIKLLGAATTGVTLESCTEAYSELMSGHYGATSEEIESLRVECAKRFPYSVAFQTDSVNERLAAYRLDRLKV